LTRKLKERWEEEGRGFQGETGNKERQTVDPQNRLNCFNGWMGVDDVYGMAFRQIT
jgi:hypothetical protein